ncbi:MAG: hypothetical protein KTR33_16270, partial [Gammaproteobacteria bacterium]|nr:hypothetical protein [Gammaproteobacteria bacterium]
RLDCDVVLEAGRVLADSPYVPGTEPVVRLLQNGGEVELEVQSGQVQLGRACLSPGDSGLLPAGSSLQIGESSIQLVPSVSDVPGFDVHPATASLVQASPDAARQSLPVLHKTVLGVGVVAAMLFLVMGLVKMFAPVKEEVPVAARPANLTTQLASAGFVSVNVVPLDNDQMLLSGYVPTRARLIELKSLAGSHDDQVSVEVKVGEELEEAVTALYRVHGVQAQVTASAPGTVTVITEESDLQLLQSIEQRAQADVAALEAIELVNTPPSPTHEADAATHPGKRIVSVISTEPAHILTEDGTRYFPGAILPNGYKIIAIRDQMVDLARDDEHIELVF